MPNAPNSSISLPPEVEEVFREFRTCEMSTLARDRSPITWPTLPFWRPEEGRFLITTSIGLPHKAFNIRHNPRVSLLFSDPTASGLTDPPAVLVQGNAEAPDEVETTLEGFEEEMRKYDARKTLEAFSAKLRDETDLASLNNELVGVIKETTQPTHVSLWLRPDPLMRRSDVPE